MTAKEHVIVEDSLDADDMGRSAIALFILSFLTIFIAFWTGITGCWKRSPGNITATAILMLLAYDGTTKKTGSVPVKTIIPRIVLPSEVKISARPAAQNSLPWSITRYNIRSVVSQRFPSEPNLSQKSTRRGVQVITGGLIAAGAMGLWHGVEYYEKERVVGEEFYQQWNNVLRDASITVYDWSFFLVWSGVGFSFVSAVLFSGAAICLRMYPQKQQYAYPPGYPPAAYAPGPPYYHGSQYGPYNY
ncbi:unnamed protein product [Nezara viridula]|uniref:Uncharacterized protein n=1 Tax=Nezara viridula TaxID=85310 RepID=A0A9P0E1L9_NEZVI|nr:unnamed protein product [Nezara viridula]